VVRRRTAQNGVHDADGSRRHARVCLPCGFSTDGLPYSIHFTGRRLAESMLCRIAHAYEHTTEWHLRHPDVKTD
jgi:Asp-tRNA(Asn)/Glu-tRNA(Gln) amidotransferase A subunit family amidase